MDCAASGPRLRGPLPGHTPTMPQGHAWAQVRRLRALPTPRTRVVRIPSLYNGWVKNRLSQEGQTETTHGRWTPGVRRSADGTEAIDRRCERWPGKCVDVVRPMVSGASGRHRVHGVF